MVDKVTQANKRIAAQSAKAAKGPVGAGIFELPTFAKSMTPQMLFDLAKDRGVITKEEQANFTKRVGRDPRALAEYNAKVPPSLKYQGIQPELKGVFASQGATPMTADNKQLRADTSKLAKKTFDQVNAMDAPKETKIQKFMEIFVSKAKNVSPEAALNLARRFVMGLFFGGPSTMAADLIPQSVMESMAQDLGVMEKEPMTFRDGGIASINDIIKPVGV